MRLSRFNLGLERRYRFSNVTCTTASYQGRCWQRSYPQCIS